MSGKEYKKLTEWEPKKGDVFRSKHGIKTTCTSETHARGERWPSGEADKPFEWFSQPVTRISRAKDGGRMTKREFRALREKLGIEQQRFADFVGVNVSTVRRWEVCDQPLPKWAEIILMQAASGKVRITPAAIKAGGLTKHGKLSLDDLTG